MSKHDYINSEFSFRITTYTALKSPFGGIGKPKYVLLKKHGNLRKRLIDQHIKLCFKHKHYKNITIAGI